MGLETCCHPAAGPVLTSATCSQVKLQTRHLQPLHDEVQKSLAQAPWRRQQERSPKRPATGQVLSAAAQPLCIIACQPPCHADAGEMWPCCPFPSPVQQQDLYAPSLGTSLGLCPCDDSRGRGQHRKVEGCTVLLCTPCTI